MSKGPGAFSSNHCISLPLFPEKPPSHAHLFRGWSVPGLGHAHFVEFFTYPVNGSATDRHVHTYQGHSSVSSGHFHRFIGTTGVAIPLPDGSHVHNIVGVVDDEPFEFKGGFYVTLTRIKRHAHEFKGFTGTGLGYEPADW